MLNKIENVITKTIGIAIMFYMTDYAIVQYYGWVGAGLATYGGLGIMLGQLILAEGFGIKLKLTFNQKSVASEPAG